MIFILCGNMCYENNVSLKLPTTLKKSCGIGKYYGLAFSDVNIYMQKNHVACCEIGHRHAKRLAKFTV